MKSYTHEEIKQAWDRYGEDWCFKYLISGNWKISRFKPDEPGGITKIQRCRIKDCIGFPRYLKDFFIV